MLNNLKIGTRLTVGFALVLALLVAVTGVGINRIGHIFDDTEEIFHRFNFQDDMVTEMAHQLEITSGDIRDLLLKNDPEEKKALTADIAKARETYDELAKKLEASVQSDASKSVVAEIAALVPRARAANNQAITGPGRANQGVRARALR